MKVFDNRVLEPGLNGVSQNETSRVTLGGTSSL